MTDAMQVKEALTLAWEKYEKLFGEPPHGTAKQIAALVELMPSILAPSPAVLDPVTVEACAKAAENVDDVLRGGCDSPDQEWLWTNGGREMQSDIAEAIRALIGQPKE